MPDIDNRLPTFDAVLDECQRVDEEDLIEDCDTTRVARAAVTDVYGEHSIGYPRENIDVYAATDDISGALGTCLPWGDGGVCRRVGANTLHFDRLDGAAIVLDRTKLAEYTLDSVRRVARHELAHAIEIHRYGSFLDEAEPRFVRLCKTFGAVHNSLDGEAHTVQRRDEMVESVEVEVTVGASDAE